MSARNSQDMDIDGPINGPGTLKRCSSAPLINESTNTETKHSTSNVREQTIFNSFGENSIRTRRFSASFSPAPGSPVSLRLTPSRINQLRQEEHEVASNSRELAHEKQIHSAMQISQSWEDLRLMGEGDQKQSKTGPLHVNLPFNNLHYNSPSPTSFGSGFQSPTRTKTFIRRSESPVLRQSPLGAKRKLDDDHMDSCANPRPKKVYFTERGLLTTSANSLQGSVSSVGTPESLSSAGSPTFAFQSVDSPSPTRNSQEPMVVTKTDHDMSESPS